MGPHNLRSWGVTITTVPVLGWSSKWSFNPANSIPGSLNFTLPKGPVLDISWGTWAVFVRRVVLILCFFLGGVHPLGGNKTKKTSNNTKKKIRNTISDLWIFTPLKNPSKILVWFEKTPLWVPIGFNFRHSQWNHFSGHVSLGCNANLGPSSSHLPE